MAVVMRSNCLPVTKSHVDDKGLRGSTSRIDKLASMAVNQFYGGFTEYVQLKEEYRKAHPRKQLRAGRLYDITHETDAIGYAFAHITPYIREGELIAGAHKRDAECTSWDWLPDGGDHYIDGFAANTPEQRADIREKSERGLYSPQGAFNHKCNDWELLIARGSLDVIREAQELLLAGDDDARGVAQAFIATHKGLIAFANNCAATCRELSENEANEIRKQELLDIADICEKVPANATQSFREAIQSYWFYFMLGGDGVGRLDKILYPYYKRDLESGAITREQALELVENLLIKLQADFCEGVCNVSSISTMTLGGSNADGSDACNDMTRIIMSAYRNVHMLRPSMYLRLSGSTPVDILELAVTLLAEGVGEPCFYCDESTIKGLVRLGVPHVDACDFALSGCAEVVIPGKCNFGAPNGWINIAMAADEVLRECAENGADYDAFWRALEQKADSIADDCAYMMNYIDEKESWPRPETTVTSLQCLARGRDCISGGFDSYMSHWEGCGLSNAADMIYSALKLGFDAGVPLDELYERLDDGDEIFAAQIRRLPKLGNAVDEVDTIAARIVDIFADRLERRSTPLRKHLVLGHLAGGENMHIAYGIRMKATLDGRKSSEPLGDSLIGSQGMNKLGPTAAIKSLTRIDHSKLAAGNVSTLRLSERDLQTQSGRQGVVALLQAYAQMGGSQLQINAISAEKLRAAQLDPVAYGGTIVRVAGYSSDFTHLNKNVQDEIIARTEGF